MTKYRIVKHEYPNGKIGYEVQKKILGLFWWNFENVDGSTTGFYDTIGEAKTAIKMGRKDLHKKTIINVDDYGNSKIPTQETEPFEAEHGKYYYCIKDYFCGGRKQASKGDVIQALRGLPIMGLKDASEYFLPVNFIKCNSAWKPSDEQINAIRLKIKENKAMNKEEKDKLIFQLKIIRDSFFGNCVSTKDKQLLLEDLSARLPYGVNVTTTNPAAEFGVMSGISIKGKISVSTKDADIVFECTEVKPYLRPMSSMTEEERQEYGLILCGELSINQYVWLNAHYFDYRGLIEKGLAIEAPEGMYN